MTGFSSSFLLLFYQISLGGLFAMAAAPFHELERGFFKSTGAVLFVIGLLGLWGKTQIQAQLIEGGTLSFAAAAEITALAAGAGPPANRMPTRLKLCPCRGGGFNVLDMLDRIQKRTG